MHTHTHTSSWSLKPLSHTSSHISAVTLGWSDETHRKPQSLKLTYFSPLSHPSIAPSAGFTPGSGEVSGTALKNDHHPLIFSEAQPSLLQIKALTPLLLRMLRSKTKEWFSALCHLSFQPLLFSLLHVSVTASHSLIHFSWLYGIIGPTARCLYSFASNWLCSSWAAQGWCSKL